MKRIITFLEAVKHCEVTGHYSYNGYDIICDEKLILHDLSSLCDSAITALIEIQSPNLSLVGRLVEEASNIICDNIKRMEAEQYSSDLLRYRVLYYLNQQKRSLDRFRGFLDVLLLPSERSNCVKGEQTIKELPCNPSNCYTAKEICQRIPQLSYNDVKDRKWRVANDFPNNPTYKGKQLYHEPAVLKWLEEHSGYGCRISRSEVRNLKY